MDQLLSEIEKRTKTFFSTKSKGSKKAIGQFFTPKTIAVFMASLLPIEAKSDVLRILDPGAGSGILSIALLDRIEKEHSAKRVELVCFENDPDILPLLRSNLKFASLSFTFDFHFSIRTEDYVDNPENVFNLSAKSSASSAFDFVIANPPFKKLSINSGAAHKMASICHGAPNLYFLFAALSLSQLKKEGSMVYILPRSWTSGEYFKSFRNYLFSNGLLIRAHLFSSRTKVFSDEKVLQETMIICVRRTSNACPQLTISSSESVTDLANPQKVTVPYSLAINGAEKYVFLPTSQAEVNIISRVMALHSTLESLGLKMKTGLVVNFRSEECLFKNECPNAIPILYPYHLVNGRISFPKRDEINYLIPAKKGMAQDNKNYLLVKRFTSKEEKSRLQSAVYLSDSQISSKISTDNKLNFIDGEKSIMTKEVVYGLFVVFSSSLYDGFYRILNGSTQVNSSEVNNFPMPSLLSIINMGKKLLSSGDMSRETCNTILEESI
jgi:adenine-specific DNA-methyltransferase